MSILLQPNNIINGKYTGSCYAFGASGGLFVSQGFTEPIRLREDDMLEKYDVVKDMYRVANLCEVKKIVVTVYERDKTGIGCQTGDDSYQRNEKTFAYIDKLRVFLAISKHKKALVVHV
jgi:hypothetical protein